jgi:hypothetical protein
MARDSNSFNRPKPKFKPQPTVLVICEDSKSGERYLKDASRYFRVNILVEITHCGNTDPKGIVTEAISRQGKFDHVFCAIDRDTHKNFDDEALNLAKSSKKVEIIVSYPCFEFWLLLHFGYNRKPYAAAGKNSAADLLIKALRVHPGLEKYDKGEDMGIFQLLLSRFAEARRIAPKVLVEAIASEQMNPSTQLHELLDFFEKLSSPQLVTPTL